MKIHVLNQTDEMARAAAQQAARVLRAAIAARGDARFIAATGNSQLTFLDALCKEPDIDWSRTTMFHLDEYVGVDEQHPASFVRYLRERFVEVVNPGVVHFVNGMAADIDSECERLSMLIAEKTIDVAFVGIGENGHLAFNDPPADFNTNAPYIVVELDEACRLQQVNEGWFPTITDVPRKAVSMSIQQIMKATEIVCTVPDERKAQAVRDCLSPSLPVDPVRPASILRKHERCNVYLDRYSASRL